MSKDKLYCSFCGKERGEVLRLIAGPAVFICDECVDLCVDIVRDARACALGCVHGPRIAIAADFGLRERLEVAR